MANRRRENPLMEWISDNLRYLLLLAVLILVGVVAIYGTKLFRSGKKADGTSSSSAAVSAEPTEKVTSSSGGEKVSSSSGEKTASGTDLSSYTVEEDKGDIYQAVSDYLSTQLASENNEFVQSFSNLVVYVGKGVDQKGSVAFAQYDFRYKNYDAEIPTLEEYYVTTDADGKLQVQASAEGDLEKYLTEVEETKAVKDLVSEVQTRYDELLKSDPSLLDYMNTNGLG